MPDIETTAILRLDELEAQVRKLRADRDAVFFELEELKANIDGVYESLAHIGG